MNANELNTIQSNLSFSYVHAVVSRLGGACSLLGKTEDDMGIDATLTFTGNYSRKPVFTQISINIQLKSSRQILTVADGKISYPLTAAQYQKYTQRSTTEFLFILFCVPEHPEQWLSLSENELILRKCAYWTSLNDAPPCTGGGMTIHIPKKNLFSVENVRNDILATLSKAQRLKYGA